MTRNHLHREVFSTKRATIIKPCHRHHISSIFNFDGACGKNEPFQMVDTLLMKVNCVGDLDNAQNRIPEFKGDLEPVTQTQMETDSSIPGHEALKFIRRTERASKPNIQFVHSLRSRTVWIQADDLDNSVSC